jgi:uncharacterized membrane protein
MLIGIGAGAVLYPGGTRGRLLAGAARVTGMARSASVLGGRSLVVYLTHQLLLIPAVWAVLVVAGADVPWPF